jgi:excisionase family DNA binding protein
MESLLLSKQQAAQMLGISLRSLEHLIAKQELQILRIGRRVLVSRTALVSFAGSQRPEDSRQEDRCDP